MSVAQHRDKTDRGQDGGLWDEADDEEDGDGTQHDDHILLPAEDSVLRLDHVHRLPPSFLTPESDGDDACAGHDDGEGDERRRHVVDVVRDVEHRVRKLTENDVQFCFIRRRDETPIKVYCVIKRKQVKRCDYKN